MNHFWWGEAPAWPETFNEAAGLDESQGSARPMRVPSRGSDLSLLSRFSTNGCCIAQSPRFIMPHDIPRLGKRIGVAKLLGLSMPAASSQLSSHSGASPHQKGS
jgi:hypothetical protein